MLDTVLASFANDMWASKAFGGYLTSFFNIGSICMAFLCGPMVSRLGKRRCLILGAVIFSLPTFFCPIWPSPSFTLFTRLIQGIAKGIVTVAASSVVADVVPRSRMNEGMGLYSLGNTLAMAFGPMIALAMVQGGSYARVFITAAVIYLSITIWSAGLNYEKKTAAGTKKSAEAPRPPDQTAYRGVWRLIERRALPPSLNYTLCFASFSGVLIFITVYSQECLHLSASQIGLFYTTAAISMFAFRILFGRMGDRFGPLTMIVPGHASIVLLLVILAFFAAKSYVLYLLCGVLYGVANSALMPTFNALAITESPGGRSSIANATFYFTMDFGILFGSSLYGRIIDAAATPGVGYRNMFLCSIFVCLCSLVLSLILFHSKAIRRRGAIDEENKAEKGACN